MLHRFYQSGWLLHIGPQKLEIVESDHDFNSEDGPITLKWSFDDQGRLISKLNQLAIDIPNSDAKDGAILQTFSTNAGGDNQVWMITDRPLGNGFALRSKLKPQLNLVMQICPNTNDIRLAVFNGSDEQRWMLTPAGYLVSCKRSATGKNWFISTAGMSHRSFVDHSS